MTDEDICNLSTKIASPSCQDHVSAILPKKNNKTFFFVSVPTFEVKFQILYTIYWQKF